MKSLVCLWRFKSKQFKALVNNKGIYSIWWIYLNRIKNCDQNYITFKNKKQKVNWKKEIFWLINKTVAPLKPLPMFIWHIWQEKRTKKALFWFCMKIIVLNLSQSNKPRLKTLSFVVDFDSRPDWYIYIDKTKKHIHKYFP